MTTSSSSAAALLMPAFNMTQANALVRNFYTPILVTQFGAVGDGVTNDTIAIQKALDYSRFVIFPSAPYLCDSLNITNDNQIIQANSVTLKARSNGTKILHWSSSYGGILGKLTLNANSKSSVRGLSVTPQDESQTTTRINQNYNYFQGIDFLGCEEAYVLQCGPDVLGADSGCWENTLMNFTTLGCTRSIWLKDGPNASSSGCNRNRFAFGRIGQSSNTGMQIDSGGGNVAAFIAFEGNSNGTSPNAIPTAVYIKQAGLYSGDNNSNRLFGCDGEGNTRDLNNANRYTELHGCALTTNNLYTANPLVNTGYDYANTPYWLGDGLLMQSNSQVPAYPNGANWFLRQILKASTTSASSLNIPSGTAPTSPVDGDIWFDGSNLKIRISGATKTFTVT